MVLGLFSDAQFFDGFSNGLALAEQDLSLSQFGEDFFRGVFFDCHFLPPLALILTLGLDQIPGGRSLYGPAVFWTINENFMAEIESIK